MKRKAIAAILLVIAILAGVTTASAGSTFPDVSDTAWYADYVAQAAAEHMVEGYPDGTFKPDKLLKYGEFIAMMVEQQTTNAVLSQQKSDNWAFPYYNKGLELGYYSESAIPVSKLNEPIPRRAMAKITAGFLMKNADLPERIPVRIYSDMAYDDPDEYYISLCSEVQVLEGYTADNSFKPEKTLKRSEAVKVAVCSMELKKAKLQGSQPMPPAGQEDPVKKQAPDMKIIGYDAAGYPLVTNVSGLIPKDRKVVLDSIKDSIKITKENGKFYFSYTQPQIPENWRISIACLVFNSSGRGISTYGNDKGVGIHPELWPEIRRAKSVKEELTGVGNILDDKTISITISIDEKPRSGLFGATTYQMVQDPTEKDFFRIHAGFNGEGYIETIETPPCFKYWN